MRTISVVNQKGGCGKTTTAITLASVYAGRGFRTLLVDLDPQAHCAAGLGVPEEQIEFSIGEAMLHEDPKLIDPTRLVWGVARGLDLAPSTMRLAALEAPDGGLHALPDKDCRLREVLAALSHRYDRCLIDCAPTIGLLTFNAMRAAREVLIPVETGYFALKGAEKQWQTIQRVIKRIGRPIACHILPTLHDENATLSNDILAALRRQFAGQILPVVIREHETLREAASMGQAVVEFAPDSGARRDYEELCDWLEEHAIRPRVQVEVFCDQSRLPPIASAGPEPQDRSRAESFGGTRGRAAELAARLRDLRVHSSESRDARHEPAASSGAVVVMVDSVESPKQTGEPGPSGAGTPTKTSVETVDTGEQEGQRPPAGAVADPDERPQRKLNQIAHLYGAKCTTQGVIFVQPEHAGDTIYVAGDFNNWSPTASPLRPNAEIGVSEALLRVAPGRHRYRLVIGGKWQADPYNDHSEHNEYGELNSILVVPETTPP